jgi:hypothetical protein
MKTLEKKPGFRVHVGYTSAGNDRWRYFWTLEDANEFCNRVIDRTKIVLAIEKKPPYSKDRKLQLCSGCNRYWPRYLNLCPICNA